MKRLVKKLLFHLIFWPVLIISATLLYIHLMSDGQELVSNARATAFVAWVHQTISDQDFDSTFEATDSRFSASLIQLTEIESSIYTLKNASSSQRVLISSSLAQRLDKKIDDGEAETGKVRFVVNENCFEIVDVNAIFGARHNQPCLEVRLYK